MRCTLLVCPVHTHPVTPAPGETNAAQYLSVFPSPPIASKIGIKLMAVTDGGFTSNTLLATGLTPAA